MGARGLQPDRAERHPVHRLTAPLLSERRGARAGNARGPRRLADLSVEQGTGALNAVRRLAAGAALRPALALLLACLAAGSGAAFGQRETAAPPAQPAAPDALSADAPADSVDARMQELGFQLPRRAVQAASFDLQDLAGATHSLAAYRGSVVFLNFWATWCGPCRTEMPAMQELHESLGAGADFVMLAVNLQEDAGQVRRFAAEMGLSFQILLDSSGEIAAAYGARTLPMSYLIDKDGSILARVIGIRGWDQPEFERLFRTLAERPPAPG